MIAAILQLSLFLFPITSAYAVQAKKDILIAVTYTTDTPVQVCTEEFALQDIEMTMARDAHCWTPKTNIGDIDVWENTDINDVNYRVTVRYKDGTVVVINLTTVMNT